MRGGTSGSFYGRVVVTVLTSGSWGRGRVAGRVGFTSAMVLISMTCMSEITNSLSGRFNSIINHGLPGTSLPILLRYLSLSDKVPLKRGTIRMLFVCSRRDGGVSTFRPSSLRGRLGGITFGDRLKRFTLCSFRPSSVTDHRRLFLRSLEIIISTGRIGQIVVIPTRRRCKSGIPTVLGGISKGRGVAMFNVGPPADRITCR